MPARPTEALGASGKFAREQRVRHRRDYARIQESGLRVHTDAFTLIASPRADGTEARLGCAVSRRVGNAVVRNRVRRLLKEVFRRRASSLPAVDFVVIAKPSAADVGRAGLDAVDAQLTSAFAQALDRLARPRTEHRPRSARGSGPKPRGRGAP